MTNTASRVRKKFKWVEIVIYIISHRDLGYGKKFIEMGKKIKKGDTIMIVEAMKTMNHVPSPSDGIVKEVSVEDGQPIEFGQKLLILE